MNKSNTGTWFEQLFGFPEMDYDYRETQNKFSIRGSKLHSHENGRKFEIGKFSTPTLESLRGRVRGARRGKLKVRHEVVGDILELHAKPENHGALFQVASQFNCLEFPGPKVTPERGITHYAMDPTQGPACSLAAAAATVYRNYLVPVDGIAGQTENRQINNLDTLEAVESLGSFFEVRNGYVFSDTRRLKRLNKIIDSLDRDLLVGRVKVGLQTEVGVTFSKRFAEPRSPTFVSQGFCSAVSASYTKVDLDLWESLATIALDAAYEATLLAAAVDKRVTNKKVWLTFIGGGAFGNRKIWIANAIARALDQLEGISLDVRVAHYKHLDSEMIKMIGDARKVRVRNPKGYLESDPSNNLIIRCRELWEIYYNNPTQRNLRKVFDHVDTMEGSEDKNVILERDACLRAAERES